MLGSPRRRLPGSRQVRLSVAAFGKHPAWRDHIDEDVLIAAETDEVKLLERWLHGSIFEEFVSKSAIGTLSADNLIPFDHLIVRSGPTGCSITRVWDSTDYSARAKFPMAISIDAEGLGVDDALRRALPALEACAARVRQIGDELRARIDAEDPAHTGSLDLAQSRRAVREAVETLRQQLASTITAPTDADPDAGAFVRELQAHADSGPGGQGLARVFYRLERLKPSDGGSKSITRIQSARRWRLPRAADTDDQSVRRWLAFLSFLAPDLPMITLGIPRKHAWVDLFVGDVGVGELERLRLSEKAESIESRTSYSAVNSAYISATEETIVGWLRDGPRSAAPAPVPAAASAGQPAAAEKKGLGRRWRDWLIGGGGAIALAALVGFLVISRGRQSGTDQASANPPPPAAIEPAKPTAPAVSPAPAAPIATTPAPSPPANPTASAPAPPAEPANPPPETPVVARLAPELTRASFTLEPVSSTWKASIAEAERSSDSPEEVQTRLDLTRRGLEEIDRALAFPPDASEPKEASDAAKRLWEPRATAIASQLAGTAVREARAGSALSRERAQSAAAELKNALTGARERGQAFGRVVSDLGAGKTIKQIARDGMPETPTRLDPAWEDVARLWAPEAFVAVKQATETATEPSADRLLLTIQASPPATLGLSQTAWERLEELAPKLTERQVETIPGALQGLLSRIAPENVAHAAAKDRARRIVAGRLASPPMSDTVAAACVRALDAVGPASSGGDLLPIAAANLALARLKAAAPAQTDASVLREAVVALQKNHGIAIELPSADPHSQKADPELFKNVGPAAKGWTVSLSPDMDVATFTRDKHTLKFQRVQTAAESAAGATYLCTTELPVAIMLDAIGRTPSGWAAFAQHIAPPGDRGEDPRSGIRTWHYGQRNFARLEPATVDGKLDARAWLDRSCTYADGAAPPPPTPRSPAQYLSFAAAVNLAQTLGCRLPSSAEWLAAASQLPPEIKGWNRRDATWLRYAQHFVRHPCPAGSPAPDIFHPGTPDESLAAVAEDDGVLWLSDVAAGPDTPFRHLVGNVSEWCFEQPTLLESGGLKAESVQTKDARIVGASALSGPAVDPLKPCPVSEVDAANPLGFSDVGVRLAFTSPVGRAGTELHLIRQAIQRASYRTEP